jgi:hypothetical protein
MSDRASTLVSPAACSGFMYAGVPTTKPVSVSCSPPAAPRARAIPKFRHQRLATRQQDVLRLNVPVHHAVTVGIVERVSDLSRDAERFVEGELPLPGDPVAQRFPLHNRHHVIDKRLGRSRVVQREDVRVAEPCRDLDLAQEAVGADDGGEIGSQHLIATWR